MGTLRLLLSVAVVFTHANTFFEFHLIHGALAVEVFFIISGFYMSMILENKYTGDKGYLLFITNRALRIYPMFLFMLLLTILLSVLYYYAFDRGLLLSHYIDNFDVIGLEKISILFMSNVSLICQDFIVFFGMDELGRFSLSRENPQLLPLHSFLLVPQAWTLSMEFMFYLIAPFLIKRKRLLFSIFFLSLLSKVILINTLWNDTDSWPNRFFPMELFLFITGIFSYQIYKKLSANTLKKSYLIYFLLLLPLVFYKKLPDSALINFVLYFLCFITIPFIFHLSKHSIIDRFLGELSYPLYISHILIISVLSNGLELFEINFLDIGEITLVFSLVFSYFLIRIIGEPVEKIRSDRVRILNSSFNHIK